MRSMFPSEETLVCLVWRARKPGAEGKRAQAQLCHALYPCMAALAQAAVGRAGVRLAYPEAADLVQDGAVTLLLRLTRRWRSNGGRGRFCRYLSKSLRLDFEKTLRRESMRSSALIPIESPEEEWGANGVCVGWHEYSAAWCIDPERDVRLSYREPGYEAVEVEQLLNLSALVEPLGTWAIRMDIALGKCSIRELVGIVRKAFRGAGFSRRNISRMSIYRARQRAVCVLRRMLI